jgi:hypothetical protein
MESESRRRGDRAANPLGRKTQVGGGLAVLIGVLLFYSLPAAVPGSPLDGHQMARVFIGFGIFLVAAGTIARWLFLD